MVVATLGFVCFPLGFLDGAAPFWQRPVGDAAEHIIGGRYFIADAWRLPLLFVPGLGIPEGTNIGLTDSIPLAAVLAKLLRGAAGFQRPYLPFWIFACFVLQAPAAALALWAAGVRRGRFLALGGLIVLFTPILWFRFAHAALCAQFLILLALALHLRLARSGYRQTWLALYVPLLCLTLLVHVYLFAMLFAILLASLLQGLWQEQITIGQALGQLAANGVAVVLVMWACGYLTLGPIPMKPYGSYALDLAAPFSPGPSGVFGIASLPPGRNFEGFAWPGAGMALLTIVTGFACRRRLGAIFADHFPLVAILGALIVFALSYAVRFGPDLVLGIGFDTVRRAALASQQHDGMLRTLLAMLRPADYVRLALYGVTMGGLFAAALGYAWWRRRFRFLWFVVGGTIGVLLLAAIRPSVVALVVSSFQASGRFVWVPLYLLAVAAIAGTCRAFRPAVAGAVLIIALALQMIDIGPFWRMLQNDALADPAPLPAAPAISTAVAQAQRLILVPTYLCAYAEPLDPSQRDALIARLTAVQVVASRQAVPINSVRNSRMTATDTALMASQCAHDRAIAAAHIADPGVVTLVFDKAPAEAGLRATLASRPECQKLPEGVLCGGTSR